MAPNYVRLPCTFLLYDRLFCQVHLIQNKCDYPGSNGNVVNISEDRLRNLLGDVIDTKLQTKNQELAAQLGRIEKSVHRMADQFESIRNGEIGDAALRVTTEQGSVDLALAHVSLPREDGYPYTCGLLAEKLKIRNHDVLLMIKKFELRGDPKYHHLFRTGKKSSVPRWSEETYLKLKDAIKSGEYEGHLEK